MLCSQILQNNYPSVNLSDTVSFALELMEEYDVQHMAVIAEEKCVGIIAKEDLLDANEMQLIKSLEPTFLNVLAKTDEHFLSALKLIGEHQLSLLPIADAQSNFAGIITATDLLARLSSFLGLEEQGAVIVLEMDKRHFSFGEISRLVETNDAYITQMNTTVSKETGMIMVTLKISKPEVSDIIATFQRYEYTVLYFFGEEQYANEIQENYRHLVNYLNM